MKSGSSIIALDLYDWLPSYGESAVHLRSEGTEWVVGITYDDQAGTAVLKRELRFNGVSAIYEAAFPGPHMLGIEYDNSGAGSRAGALREFPQSEAALAWTSHWRANWQDTRRAIKHYSITFAAENLKVEVFAEGVILTDPVLVKSL